ncbi:hypothetical protein ERJ75_001782300 [Trypanosoma vivax]|nr:hypothetical protein ERJ75_001782300 [Trypanosoma vivax]
MRRDSRATACVCYDHHRGTYHGQTQSPKWKPSSNTARRHDRTRPTATEAEVSTDARQEATRASQTQEASQQGTQDNAQAMARTHKTPRPSNAEQENAPQSRAKPTTRKRQRWQDRETECGPAHPAWNTDTKTCSTTRRSAHVTAILTLLATALDAQDTRMAHKYCSDAKSNQPVWTAHGGKRQREAPTRQGMARKGEAGGKKKEEKGGAVHRSRWREVNRLGTGKGKHGQLAKQLCPTQGSRATDEATPQHSPLNKEQTE